MDNIYLTGPLGTQWNIGSWIDKTQTVDYGSKGLIRQQLSQLSPAEGARLAYETVAGPRAMSFPIRVPSGGVSGLSLETIEASLRQMVRPGGYVDLQPDGIPTAEMVRFDVLGGDVADSYNIDLQRVARRGMTLGLQTQPLGYWPTWIIAASVASVAMNGAGRVSLTAPVGDVPGLAELLIVPTAPTQMASLIGQEAWFVDGIAWANGARPSFLAGLGGGSWGGSPNPVAGIVASSGYVMAVGISPTYQSVVYPAANGSQWFNLFSYTIPSALEPAYRGRFRGFAQLISQGNVVRVGLDVVPANNLLTAFASAAQVATSVATAARTLQLLDLGEFTMPPVASGVQGAETLRLWFNTPSIATNINSVYFVGAYLQPLDGQAGILARGLAQPSIGGATANTQNAGVLLRRESGGPIGVVASDPVAALNARYYGQLPLHGATVQQLDLLAISRKSGGASAGFDTFVANNPYAAVSVRYRPRFQFLKGI